MTVSFKIYRPKIKRDSCSVSVSARDMGSVMLPPSGFTAKMHLQIYQIKHYLNKTILIQTLIQTTIHTSVE